MESKKWYSIGNQEGVTCINCNHRITRVGYIHTNTGVCPTCKIPCIFYGIGKNDVIQVLPDKAPDSFKKFISWFQTELNELEFIELIGSFRRIIKGLSTKP